eukprot:CAMPEP_0183380520 /NCGR_PEP_ID=MMETSP0164_2-20130417/125975_1 /TAXON_ID=221442 /ORGANISM="Coccolithus pelagicus ssp braarudi, Strain PLY182g" /LENGTH=257 /DNA_ID=CAMNT_0025558117 /DNA_START=466 /DNA_END=1236 /DNA_ORIENTATION=+
MAFSQKATTTQLVYEEADGVLPGKTDLDSYVQTQQLFADLSMLPTRGQAYGLGHFMRRKRPRVKELIEPIFYSYFESLWTRGPFDLNRQWGRMRRMGLYPFVSGPFYALTRDLVACMLNGLEEWSNVSAARNTSAISLGEDAFIFFALHVGTTRTNGTVTFQHVTWTRSHNLPSARADVGRPAKPGMGWMHPSSTSFIVHWLKFGKWQWRLVHTTLANASTPVFTPFAFRWHARSSTFEHAAAGQASRWAAYIRICW